MTTTLDVSQIGPQLSQLLETAQTGDEIVLTQNGAPIARVTTLDHDGVAATNGQHENEQTEKKPRVLGLGRGTIWVSDDFDEPLPDEFWEGDIFPR